MKEVDMFNYVKGMYSDLEKSPNETDGYDCISHEHKLYIELKARRTHYDTLLLENKKYNFLIENAKELGYTPLYINWTPQGMWAFTLNPDATSYEWSDQWLPVTTDFANNSKTTKQVTFLDIKDGTKI